MDIQYIQQVKAGNTEAFRFLVEKYQDRALAAAFRVVKNHETAEDIVQEAFLKAFKNLDAFRGDALFSTWFLRIVVNEALTFVQRRKLEGNYAVEMAVTSVPEVNSSLQSLKEEEQRRFIDIAMQQLSSREALVLQLFYIDGLSLKEMEEVMDLNADHIKVLLHRARKQFFDILQHELKHELSSLL